MEDISVRAIEYVRPDMQLDEISLHGEQIFSAIRTRLLRYYG